MRVLMAQVERRQGWRPRRGAAGLLVAFALLTTGLAACSGGGDSDKGAGPSPSSSSSSRPESTSVGDPSEVPAVPEGDPMLAQGEDIFQRTAGEVGCASCHGANARGDIGPNVLGKSAGTIRANLRDNPAMTFIVLSDEEVEAVAAYLAWLEDQGQPGGT